MTNFEIAITVAGKVTGAGKKKILSPSRELAAVEARQIAALLLHSEGYTDEHISWILNRQTATIRKARRAAAQSLKLSKLFYEKYSRAKEKYEEQKSLRISQG